MSKRSQLLSSIAATIADYRQGEIPEPTADHVDTWVRQFDSGVRLPILQELDHVLKRTYLSRTQVHGFLAGLVGAPKLVGNDPCRFWRRMNFLDIQGGGNSQSEMLVIFEEALRERCGLSLADCGRRVSSYLYLDDALFSGNRALADLRQWIADEAPSEAEVHVVVIVLHQGGYWYAKQRVQQAADAAGKSVRVNWWQAVHVEDRKSEGHRCDVLRPARLPDEKLVRQYAAMLKASGHPVELRPETGKSPNDVFSSAEGRELLEQQLLLAGVRIREMCSDLPEPCRPLGYAKLHTLGFGSTYVTFRNCPNNTPLAFWVDYPWHPLFPRKVN